MILSTERSTGIEPVSLGWQPRILPLNYERIYKLESSSGFEPLCNGLQPFASPLGQLDIKHLAGLDVFETPSHGFGHRMFCHLNYKPKIIFNNWEIVPNKKATLEWLFVNPSYSNKLIILTKSRDKARPSA